MCGTQQKRKETPLNCWLCPLTQVGNWLSPQLNNYRTFCFIKYSPLHSKGPVVLLGFWILLVKQTFKHLESNEERTIWQFEKVHLNSKSQRIEFQNMAIVQKRLNFSLKWKGETETETLSLAGFLPNAHNSRGWARLGLGARNSVQVSHCSGQGPKSLSHHLWPWRRHMNRLQLGEARK